MQLDREPTTLRKKQTVHDGWQALNDELAKRTEAGKALGGRERINREHEKGKLTARERVELLVDPESFDEWGVLAHHQEDAPDMRTRSTPADGLVAGTGLVHGRQIFVAADDATVMGGSRGVVAEEKLSHLRRAAVKAGSPFIFLQEASGGRVQELRGASFAARSFRRPFREQVAMSGRIPQVAALMGSCFGGPAFVAALADFVPMTRSSAVGASGPPVVAAATGQVVSEAELGGPEVASKTGLVDATYEDEPLLISDIRSYLSFLPSNSSQRPPSLVTEDSSERKTPEVMEIVPTNLRRAYDMREVAAALADDAHTFEVGRDFGPSMLTMFARFGGESVAVVANQPLVQAGVITAAAARKAARFISFADAFHIPLVFLVDTPGFIVGSASEREGLAGSAAQLVAAIAKATVPRATVILRKAYGLGFFAMSGPPMEPDVALAWPTASISQMGPEASVDVIYRKQIQQAGDPAAVRAELVEEYRRNAANPYVAAAGAALDDVIPPDLTRIMLIRRLRAVRHEVVPTFKHDICSR